MMIFNLRPFNIPAFNYMALANHINVLVNDEPFANDGLSFPSYGIRVGTPAWTTRGYTEKDMEVVAEFLDRIRQEASKIQRSSGKEENEFKTGMKKE